MGDDEESTFEILRQCGQIIDSNVAEKGGRIVATGGDSVLAEFSSAVEAVRCALDMQSGVAKCNSDLPEVRRMRFRIGINLGDVMVSGDDILGDGVNIELRRALNRSPSPKASIFPALSMTRCATSSVSPTAISAKNWSRI